MPEDEPTAPHRNARAVGRIDEIACVSLAAPAADHSVTVSERVELPPVYRGTGALRPQHCGA